MDNSGGGYVGDCGLAKNYHAVLEQYRELML